jgi:hypothetical protein
VNGGNGVRVGGFGVRNSVQSTNSGFIQVGSSDNLYGMLDFNAYDSNTIFEVSNTNANNNAELRLGGGFITFRTASTPAERARIFATGNFGIGTGATDLGQRLQVIGDTLLRGSGNTSATTALTVQNSDSANLFRVRNDGAILISAANDSPYFAGFTGTTQFGAAQRTMGFVWNGGANRPTPSFYFTASSNINFTTSTGTFISTSFTFNPTSGTSVLNTHTIEPTINQTGGANGITRGLYVNPTLTAAADWRSIEWSNNSGWGLYGAGTAPNYLAGNLSIATTTTTRRLNLQSAIGGQASLLGMLDGGGTLSSVIGIETVSTGALQIASTNAIRFYTGTTIGNIATEPTNERMRLFSNGNLLIGSTTDSGEKLQVTGTMKVTGQTTFGGTVVILTNAPFYTGGNIYTTSSNLGIGTTTANVLGFFTNSTERMRLDATGNVGIGTNAPDAKLRVAGTANSTQAIFGSVDGRGLAISTSVISGTNEAGVIFNARSSVTSGTLIFQTDGTQRVQIDSTGLIINGGNALEFINSAANAVSAIRPTGGGTSVMSTNSNGLHIAVGTEAAGDLILASNNTERIRLSSSGWFSHTTATNPSSSVTDSYVQYSADVTAGNAAPHFRTENGAVIKLYQETTAVGNSIISLGGGNSVLDDTTFDGYTLRQIVKALRNQGILA